MSDKFLLNSNSNINLTNGSVSFYGSSIGATDLVAALPVKVDSTKRLYSSKLEIADINGLTSALSSGSGDVAGPASSTDNAIPRYDATTGKIIQDSGVIIDDSNDITGIKEIKVGDQTLYNGSAGHLNIATGSQSYCITNNSTGNNPNGPIITYIKSRGTYAIPASIQANDELGGMLFEGQYDTSQGSTLKGGKILCLANENFSASGAGSKFQFLTTEDGVGNIPVNRLTIENDGQINIISAVDSSSTVTGSLITAGGVGIVKNLSVGGGVTLSSTTDAFLTNKLTTTQRNALTPILGMSIFNTTLNLQQTYNGTSWQPIQDLSLLSAETIAITYADMTSAILPTGWVVASSSEHSSGLYDGWHAFDGLTATWISDASSYSLTTGLVISGTAGKTSSGAGEWVSFELPVVQRIKSYDITPRLGPDCPLIWNIITSFDGGTTWEIVHRVDITAGGSWTTVKTFELPNSGIDTRYIGIEIYKKIIDASIGYTALEEIKFN